MGNTCALRKPNQALAQGQCGRILSDPIETQEAARKSIQLTGCCSWIKVLREEASPFHLQGQSVLCVCRFAVPNKANSCMQMLFVEDAENTNTNRKQNTLSLGARVRRAVTNEDCFSLGYAFLTPAMLVELLRRD